MERVRNYVHEKDSQDLLEMLKSFQAHLHDVDTAEEIRTFASDDDARRYLNKMIDDVDEMNGRLLVMEVDGELVGFIQGIIDPRNDLDNVMYQTTHNPQIEGWIGLVFVDQKYRGKRLGLKLMDSMKEHFISNGCSTMRLSVASDNIDTVSFYRKYGFKEHDIEMALPL